VARWRKGQEEVARLIEQRHLQQVAADSGTAAALLASAARHVESARLTADADPEAAYALAYDAARKSATALLAHQGLRPTTAGGHVAVVDAMRSQFPGVPGLTSLDRLRRRRNRLLQLDELGILRGPGGGHLAHAGRPPGYPVSDRGRL
jgi:hypothetical protein